MGASQGQMWVMRSAVAVGVAVLAGAAVLAACGGPSSSTTTTGASGTTTSGSNSAASKLDALAGNVKAAQTSTYQAVYTSTSGGSTSSITLAQAPPKQRISSTDASGSTTSLINTGTTTYSCSSGSGGNTTCTSIGSGLASSALTGLLSVYNGKAALTVLQLWQSSLAAHLAGVSLTFSDETIAGQSATCANWSQSGNDATYCVTSTGVLAKVQSSSGSSSGQNFELTSYATSPPASTFSIPQGATVVTLPTGASAP